MKNIVWIFGNSAAGKETFINKTVNGANSSLVKELGWENHLITKIDESIKYIGQYEGDPVIKKRAEIVPAVSKIIQTNINDNIVILIKWQDVDEAFKLPEVLQKNHPNFIHTIIFLYADPDVLWERVQKKS